MKSLTCFKLCYVLGVSDVDLKVAYPLEYTVCIEQKAFHPTAAVDRFRYLSNKYFTGIRSLDGKVLAELQLSIREHNNMILQVYNELEINLPQDLFVQLTELPELTPKVTAQLMFLTNNTKHLYGLYFFGNELFNVALGSMLQDDMSLRDRLCLVSGQRLGPLYDRSYLAERVQEYMDKVFVKVSDLHKFRRLLVLNKDDASSMNFKLVTALPAVCNLPTITNEYVPQSEDTILTCDARWVSKVATKYTDVHFVVVMPVEPKYYRAWRRRALPNVYMLSLK